MLRLAVKHRLRHRLRRNVAARFDNILFKRGNSLQERLAKSLNFFSNAAEVVSESTILRLDREQPHPGDPRNY